MNLSAVYHTSSDSFCYPLDDEKLVIKLQTGYEVDRVQLMYGDPFSTGIFGSNDVWSGRLIDITDIKFLQHHKLWQIVIESPFKRCRYYFILHSNQEVYYYIEEGIKTEAEFKSYKGRRQDFFFPWMNSSDIIKPADWVNDTVWYQIFPDRFCNSGTPRHREYNKWQSPNKKVGFLDMFGGDLKGIISKLDYLQNLGINGIYFTPVNKSPSNHKYNTSDYRLIDENFGTDEDMKQLVKEAHTRGIRVMLDGVFNHSGVDFAPWQDVLENGVGSKYYDWFMINKPPVKGKKLYSQSKKGDYYTFGFFDNMPKLNTNNPQVVDYFIDVCTKWVQCYDIDAIRLDVANELSHSFNKQLRKAMFSLKFDFYICGEIWHSAMPWLRGDEYDSVMNYSLQESIDSFWANPQTTALEFEHQINRCMTMYPQQVGNVMFNMLDTHDTMRLINRCHGNIDKFYQKLCVLFTMNGTACIYYGTEVALQGGYDPDCRRCMPWEEIEKGHFDYRISLMKQLIAIRKEYSPLRKGEISFNPSTNNRVISYKKYDETLIIQVILNCSDNDITVNNDYKKVLFSNGLQGNTLNKNGCMVVVKG